MSDHRDDDQQADERLLAELRAVAQHVDAPPEAAIAAARSQLAYLRLDAELAQLTFDSLDAPEPVGVRADTQLARRLTFEAGTTEIEVEVVPEGERRRLVGQCLPPSEVEVQVRTRPAGDDTSTEDLVTAADELGRFNVEVPAGMVSLRCVWLGSELAVETAWVSI